MPYFIRQEDETKLTVFFYLGFGKLLGERLNEKQEKPFKFSPKFSAQNCGKW
jgi:hypothetical protein